MSGAEMGLELAVGGESLVSAVQHFSPLRRSSLWLFVVSGEFKKLRNMTQRFSVSSATGRGLTVISLEGSLEARFSVEEFGLMPEAIVAREEYGGG